MLDGNGPVPYNLAPPEKNYTIEEAAALIRDIQLRLISVEDYRLKLNWCFGLVVHHTGQPPRRGRETVEELARRVHAEHGVSVNVTLLYECRRLYRISTANW